MAANDAKGKTPHPFDVKTVEVLVNLMVPNDLSEIDLNDGDQRIRLRRGGRVVSSPSSFAPNPMPLAAPPPPAPAATPAAAPTPAPAAASKPGVTVKSPTPGTFYSKATPEVPPFVQVGSRVTPSTVVCLIEAMKIFNEITADVAGVVTKVCVDNQQPVEWGTVLFEVDPAG